MDRTNISKSSNLLSLVSEEKYYIKKIVLLSILSGVLSLALPLGIQLLLTFITAQEIRLGTIAILTLIIALVWINGWLQIVILKEGEKAEQRLFIQFAYTFLQRILRQDAQAKNRNFAKYFIEIGTIQKGFSKLIIELLLTLLQLIFGLLLISLYHSLFLGFSLLLVVSLYFLFKWNFAKALRTSYDESSAKYELVDWLNVTEQFRDNLNRPNTKLAHEYANGIAEKYIESKAQHFTILLRKQFAFLAFKVSTVALMLIAGTYLAITQKISIGQFLATEIVIVLIIANLEKLLLSLASIFDTLTSLEKIYAFQTSPSKPVSSIEGVEISTITSLTFTHHNREFTFLPSTLYNITRNGALDLLNALDGKLNQQQVTINGTPLNLCKEEQFKTNLAWCDNQTVILDESIFKNIQWTTNASTEEVLAVAKEIGFLKELQDRGLSFESFTTHRSEIWTTKNKALLQLMRAKLQRSSVLCIHNDYIAYHEEGIAIVRQMFNDQLVLLYSPTSLSLENVVEL